MAQLLAQEEKEKTTALKGKARSYENTMNTLQLAISLYVNRIPSIIIYMFICSIDLLSRIDLDELMKKDEPPLNFPETLDGFEYAFNERKTFRLSLL